MARISLPIPVLKDRLEVAAMTYAATEEDLGESDSKTISALDMLKETARHLYENQHPDPVDANGVRQPKSEPVLHYDRHLKTLERAHAKDVVKLLTGAPTTVSPRRN